ncbi:olfactory receptor 6B1-like [Pelodytes ibericus]
MSYDRYLAICDPLHYTSIMDFRLRSQLVLCSWLLGLLTISVIIFLVCSLQFCGPHIIDHYFCDFAPLLELSCSDYSTVKLVDVVLGIPFALVPFFFILFTYISIFITILGISSTVRKQKSFSNCSSHLIVVSAYYGTIVTVYMAPSKGQLFNINKVLSLLYTMGTPFFNPIIYSLRNQDIKIALSTEVSSMIVPSLLPSLRRFSCTKSVSSFNLSLKGKQEVWQVLFPVPVRGCEPVKQLLQSFFEPLTQSIGLRMIRGTLKGFEATALPELVSQLSCELGVLIRQHLLGKPHPSEHLE